MKEGKTGEKTLVAYFKSKAREIINKNDIETVLSDAGNELLNRINNWITKGGNGWVIKSKKISNNQELIQSDPISCLQNQKGNN